MWNKYLKRFIVLFDIGYGFSIIETLYFLDKYGNHFLPINDTEIKCDLIALIILLISFYYLLKGLIKLTNDKAKQK